MLTGGAAGPVRPDVGRTETGEACRGSSQAAMLDRLAAVRNCPREAAARGRIIGSDERLPEIEVG